MIFIQKGAEPEGLTELREKAETDGLSPTKAYGRLKKRKSLYKQVKDALVREQGQLCAYCMCRIPRSDIASGIAPIVIEHIIPRSPDDGRDVGQGLDYRNLLAVCHGNRGPRGTRRLIDLTCDAHRGNAEFRKVHPCKPETLESIYYEMDGTIYAGDADVQFDLQNTLNLNCPSAPLISERKAALDALMESLDMLPQEDLSNYCTDILHELEQETNPKTPYVGILLWYLRTLVPSLRTSD